MKRALAALLIAPAVALLGIWAWLWFAPKLRDTAAQATRPAYCDMVQLCDHAAPPPVELRPASVALSRGHRDFPLIAGLVGSEGTDHIYPYDRVFGIEPSQSGQQATVGGDAVNRLYLLRLLAGGEALVIVRDTFTQRHALLLRRGPAIAAQRLRTDPGGSFDRFALIDPRTGRGDTFQLDQRSRSEAFSYRVLAADSPAIHQQWLGARQSTCGHGPLTAVPPEWDREYTRTCRREG